MEKEGNAPSRARLQGVPLVFQHPHSSAAHTGAAPVSTHRRCARDADRVMSQLCSCSRGGGTRTQRSFAPNERAGALASATTVASPEAPREQ